MPPKRAPQAPLAPARSPAKKAPRPAATKKKQAAPRPAAMPREATQQLVSLLHDMTASAWTIVDFVVGPTCGLESLHTWVYLSNFTPFLLAVACNRLDVAQLLVAEHSVNTKAVDYRKFTALHIASGEGNVEMVRWLVERCGLDVQAVDADDQTPLHKAIDHKHSDAALLLLELGANLSHPDTHRWTTSDHLKWTPLHYACRRGMVDVARALIAKGVKIDVADSRGVTPLHCAISAELSDVAHLLLKLGADPNYTDDRGWTALHMACHANCGLVDVARMLIDKGVDIDAQDSIGMTALHMAISYGKSDVALLLLELGANPNHSSDKRQWTPLHWACYRGLVDVARALIAKGANRDAINLEGKTPIGIAAECQHSEIGADRETK